MVLVWAVIWAFWQPENALFPRPTETLSAEWDTRNALVIAKSFARIFYRNSINIGLAIVECPAAAEAIEEGHIVEADLDNGILLDKTTGVSFEAAPVPPFIQTIIANGGLIESIKKGAVK